MRVHKLFDPEKGWNGRRDFTHPEQDPANLARNLDLTQTAAYLAYCEATKSPLSFNDFMKRVVDLDTKWRRERNEENSRCIAESRAARERNQTLGPQIIYELLVEKSQLVGETGPPILEPEKLACSSCGKKFDWKRESELQWQGMNGANISVSEADLREFIESQLYQANVTRSGLYCHHEVETASWRHGRAILGSERKQPCGNKILGNYRILRK